MAKKYTHCACCDTELGDIYLFYADKFLKDGYFDEPDGSGNAFCSAKCAGLALMLDTGKNIQEE